MTLAYADAHAALLDRLDARVRETVRRDGVDPQAEVTAVRRIAEQVVTAHDERSLTGQVAPVPDPQAMVGELVARVSGFGPLQPYLDDPSVEEVWINDPSQVFVARHGRHELTTTVLTTAQVQELVERMLKSSGRRIDVSQPFVDAMLPEGHRLHVVLEGISRGFTAVNIRKFTLRASRLHDLVDLGTLTPQAARFLEASVRAGLNVLVAGGTQAGKTTLLNCLASAIPGSERVVSAEEVYELRFHHPDWVPMQTRQAGLEGTGRIALRDLVKESLRMRPSRIIVGEVRAEECLDLLLALNAGLPGMCTLHANSAREALVKMCTLPLLAGDNIGARFVVPTVAASVDLVVHLGIDHHGVRRVNEIVAVPGRVENDVIETETLFGRDGGDLVHRGGLPPRAESFTRIGIDLRQVLG
ncbi:CpaF family protein [Nocardioides guangzhouensis]|uniref:CpaF family protein n=1 Tax=Nocardioides guangzhouensis TaxID=2497878 RepID=A0A4Q4Z4I5_9ACTN|nr:ATPase, T2SS/T4P/T4SS family [Nocardioides guangzhouensis]RYP82637.1 CpaF family protein [Nocardioides guangzhouensis]